MAPIYNVASGTRTSSLSTPGAADGSAYKGIDVTQFRSFRNTDPPGLVEVWNDALTGRGAVRLRNSSPLERCTLSKLHFDPEGLILAIDEGADRCVGFVHAGFGTNAAGEALDHQSGVTCVLAVHTTHRRRGIASASLRLSEEYLRGRGART